jgi:ParB family transcriptional regulator, chromosome partitioning protein
VVSKSNKALGKGLSALLPPKSAAPVEVAGMAEVDIDIVDPHPGQPRSVFRADKLQELADSIKANGIVQPLIVQKSESRYLLIAGERRWRAAKIAGLAKVPVVIREFAPERVLEIALIENIQREDLNPIEIASALDRLLKEHGLTHDELASRTGKDRSTITNHVRLLRLPLEVQTMLNEQRLSMSHARSLLGIEDQEELLKLAEKIVSQGLSVRQTERAVLDANKPREAKAAVDQDPNVKAAVEELERALGTRVRIVEKSPENGRLEVDYYSKAELQRLYELLTGN